MHNFERQLIMLYTLKHLTLIAFILQLYILGIQYHIIQSTNYRITVVYICK